MSFPTRIAAVIGTAGLRSGLAAAVVLGALALSSVPTQAARPTTPPQTACSGVSRCSVMDRADVDGDGKADSIAVVASKVDQGGSVQVRVRTTSNGLLTQTTRDVWWFGGEPVFLGTTALDGVRGAEVVVGQSMGAHFQHFRVLTYRGGGLVWLASPKLPAKTHPLPTGPTIWAVDGSYSFNTGIARSISKTGVRVTVTALERRASGHGHAGWTSTYRWSADGWTLQSSTKVKRTTKSAYANAGWHVAGLPAFG